MNPDGTRYPSRAAHQGDQRVLAGIRLLSAVVLIGTAGLIVAPAARAATVTMPPLGAAAVLAPVPVVGTTVPAPTEAGLETAVAATIDSPAFESVGAVVLDPSDGSVLYGQGADRAAAPASTLKILTGLTVLSALGPDARIATRVVRSGDQITLVGGGDGTLTRSKSTLNGAPTASLDQLAAATAKALEKAGVTNVDLGYDTTLFTGPEVSPEWGSNLVDYGVVAPVSALMADRGRSPDGSGVSSDPADAAAAYFASRLRDLGIDVGDATARTAPADAEQLAAVSSPALAEIVEYTLTESDNDVAESLAHLAGAALVGEGSFEGGAAATAKALEAYGIPTTGMELFDGSGLARANRVSPRALAEALRVITTNVAPAGLSLTVPVGWPVATALPVAGFTGTLADRFDDSATDAATGAVRAKTGTLTGVSSLAGTVVDADGRLLVFAVLTSGAETESARIALDRFAAELAECGCGG